MLIQFYTKFGPRKVSENSKWYKDETSKISDLLFVPIEPKWSNKSDTQAKIVPELKNI